MPSLTVVLVPNVAGIGWWNYTTYCSITSLQGRVLNEATASCKGMFQPSRVMLVLPSNRVRDFVLILF